MLNVTENEMLVNIYCVNILPMLLSGLYPMSCIYCFLYVFIIWSSGRDAVVLSLKNNKTFQGFFTVHTQITEKQIYFINTEVKRIKRLLH